MGAVLAAGTVTLAVFAPHDIANPLLFAILLSCSSLASALKVSLPLASSGSTMSVSYAVDFAALLLLGADQTMIVAAASAWSQCTFRTQSRSAPYRTLFSMASLVLTVKAAGWAYTLLGGASGTPFTAGLDRQAAGRRRHHLLRLQHAAHRDRDRPVHQADDPARVERELPVERAELFRRRHRGGDRRQRHRSRRLLDGIAGAAPLYLTYRTYKVYMGRIQDQQRHVAQVSDLHLATIEALALAIDAKDQTAQSHIRRVQVYAAGLARALGMPETEIQGVKTAALLHDIGKLAVPEHILSKPGPLTQEEFQKIRIHPQVGAEIISGVPFPYPVAPLILSHHERWDGKGYPAGLKGEDIPLGARILSVVDYFDALMSERPYHKAMSIDAAMGLLRQESAQGARSARGADLHRALPGAGGRGRRQRRAVAQADARADARPNRGARRSAWSTSRRRRAPTSSRTSRSRTARSTRCTKSPRRWAAASACPTRWRSSPRS